MTANEQEENEMFLAILTLHIYKFFFFPSFILKNQLIIWSSKQKQICMYFTE